MIDLHCHILPGLDDGAADMDEALGMARAAVRDGIRTLVGTPHTLNEAFVNPAARVAEAAAAVREALARARIPLDVLPGAEVRVGPDLLDRVKDGDAGTLNHNGRYILLEFPVQSVPPRFREEVFALQRAGLVPILAHPERNLEIQRDLGFLGGLVEMGVLCQLTAMSITGEFGAGPRQCALEMLRQGLAHVIASDAHSARRRPPALTEAAECAAEILGSVPAARRMVEEVPRAILEGAPVEGPRPAAPRTKRWWFW